MHGVMESKVQLQDHVFSEWMSIRNAIDALRRRLWKLPIDGMVLWLLRELCNLEHDLYMWMPWEHFNAEEFWSKLSRIEALTKSLEEQAKQGG